MSDLLMFFNLIAIPLYCFRRFRKRSYLILLNPCFYLLALSYIYLTLSSALIERYSSMMIGLNYLVNFFKGLSEESIQATNLACNWFTLVFFLFYVLSTDRKILPSQFTPKLQTYQIAKFCAVVISAIFALLILVYGPTLLSMSASGANRGELLSYSASNIYFKFRIATLTSVLQASVAVIAWRTKKFKCYAFLLFPIILELLAQGRTASFACIVFAYINYVFITNKTKLLSVLLAIMALVATIYLRFDFNFNLENNILTILSDPILSRVSTIIVYDDFLGQGDLGQYLLMSSFRILPEQISKLIFDYESFQEIELASIVAKSYQDEVGFSLASNIVGEALYYGGITFTILSPIIIGLIFYSMNQSKIYRTFPGFIFFSFLMASLQFIMRSSFYNSFLNFVYLMFSYLIWITILEGGRTVFKKDSKRSNNVLLS